MSNLTCQKCSSLLDYLEDMLNNPPELIQIEGKPYMSSYVLAGYKQAVKEVIFFTKGQSNV